CDPNDNSAIHAESASDRNLFPAARQQVADERFEFSRHLVIGATHVTCGGPRSPFNSLACQPLVPLGHVSSIALRFPKAGRKQRVEQFSRLDASTIAPGPQCVHQDMSELRSLVSHRSVL